MAEERFTFTEELHIPTPWGYLAAKVWGPDNGVPVLALHGWQDNAGSFDTLAPLLPANVRLVCLDFCGHGLSSHYPPGMFLNYYDHVYHVKLVIDFFKWKKVSILAHSMGAITAIFFVSMFPELVDKFISLDAVKQLSSSAEYLPARMKSILNHFQEVCQRLEQGPLSTVSYEEARDKLVKNYGGSIDEKDADILLIRGLRKIKEDSDEYEFTRDLRSTIRPYIFNDFTTEQLKAVARGIVCPFLLIKAKNTSMFEPKELYREFYDLYRDASEDFRYVEVDGKHHVHLSQPELVAPIITNFLFPTKSKL
ncbi:probable serine hydrolase [Daphnia magna]|uniref:probable serine hydrolase n=1 Tax=Daphnia magna TaxID=35525 RepID=UPI0014041583|nr:probable serine hydrolase [Daphnia magna]